MKCARCDRAKQNKTPRKEELIPINTVWGIQPVSGVLYECQHPCSTQKCSDSGLTCFCFIHRASFCPPHCPKLLHGVIPIGFTWFGSVLSHTASRLAHQDCPRQAVRRPVCSTAPFFCAIRGMVSQTSFTHIPRTISRDPEPIHLLKFVAQQISPRK